MKYVNIEEVIPGTALGKEIFSMDGQVLLSKGASLTENRLMRLRKFGIEALPLDMPSSDEESFTSNTIEHYARSFLDESLRFFQNENTTWQDHVIDTITKVIEAAKTQEMLSYLRNEDDSLYAHSLMVGLISTMIGIRQGYSDQKLEVLVTAALLHDIGKVLPDSYNEQQVPLGFDHTWRGYNYLKEKEEIDHVVALVALTHHENISATGYPRKLDETSIHAYAQIVAIANVFDRLTHRRNGKALMKPADAFEFMLAFTTKRFNLLFMNEFVHCIALYPTGSQVILSNGNHGIVASQNFGLPQRPIVRVLHSSGNFKDIAVETIDLAMNHTIFITDFAS
ncbi:putative nucleotidyltransferase with HDIG domain [Alkalihalobacillus xiaoxiensis]|uniref:Nucleotidyltransferase with HDIG domain n=1 Tax=Shouchella xiaoxiensis TaxID=766895 RepID=A0ABS2SPN4_9BACI|nr:HD domain-containing phosphohydrolase [Shouchella xiaoxiensis]MBM7837483.1 putative nucleotidyltransferase with HDIG domain [Shouchella xiaoxiensis]